MHICFACLLFCIKKERGKRRKQKYTTVQNAGKHQLISLNFKKKKKISNPCVSFSFHQQRGKTEGVIYMIQEDHGRNERLQSGQQFLVQKQRSTGVRIYFFPQLLASISFIQDWAICGGTPCSSSRKNERPPEDKTIMKTTKRIALIFILAHTCAITKGEIYHHFSRASFSVNRFRVFRRDL